MTPVPGYGGECEQNASPQTLARNQKSKIENPKSLCPPLQFNLLHTPDVPQVANGEHFVEHAVDFDLLPLAVGGAEHERTEGNGGRHQRYGLDFKRLPEGVDVGACGAIVEPASDG